MLRAVRASLFVILGASAASADTVVIEIQATVSSAGAGSGPWLAAPVGTSARLRVAVVSSGTGQSPTGWAAYEILPESIELAIGPYTLASSIDGQVVDLGHGPEADEFRIESLAFEDGTTAAFVVTNATGTLFTTTDPLDDLGTHPGASLESPTFFLIAPNAFLQLTTDSLSFTHAPGVASFCAGDGLDASHTTPCPCGNTGTAGRGCANSVVALGARLDATGDPTANYAVLRADGMPATVACVYFVGDALADAPFGDGVRCTGGTLQRLGTMANVAGASRFPPEGQRVTLAERSGVLPGSSARRYYQAHYRNSAPMFCPPATFNATNGIVLDW